MHHRTRMDRHSSGPSTDLETEGKSAFSAIYRRYGADVFRFALYLTGDRDEAEDVASETFVRLWTSSAQIRTESVKGYLLTIARNVYLHERRRQIRNTGVSGDIHDPARGVHETLEQRDQLAATSAQLATLPEINRAALLMHATQDMSYQEIAEALGLSLASVKVRIHRARLALAHTRQDS